MKRLIAAVSFAVLATPALARNGKPFEPIDLDRSLADVSQSAGATEYRFDGSALYERTQVASSGEMRSDVEIAVADVSVESPWANDYHFIAPAQ